MIRYLIYSDMHWSAWDEFSRSVENDGTRRLRAQLKTCEWIVDKARELKVDQVVDCGDSVLTLGFIDSLTLTWMTKGFAVLDAVNPIRILGNHDIMSKSGLVNSVEFAKGLVRKPEMRDGVLFMPYTVEEDGGQPLIEEFSPSLVFTHNNINGAYYTSERTGRGGIDPTALGDTLLVGGHLHMPQVLNKNVLLVGSCMYHNFKDHMLDKIQRGAVYLQFDEKNPTKSWFEFLENPHTPIFHTFDHVAPADYEQFCNKHADRLPRLYARVLTDEHTLPEIEKYLKLFAGHRPQVDRAARRAMARAAVDVTNVNSIAPQLPTEIRDEVVELLRVHADKLDYALNTRIRFKRLVVRDFMSWEHLELDFTQYGLTVVDGENGAGKTAIWKALCWGCLGELPGEKLEKQADLTRREATTGTEVEVTLEKDKHEYVIRRYQNHAKHKNAVMYSMDGEDQTQRLPSETDRKIIRLLGFSKDFFTKMIYSHGPEMVKNRFSILTEAGRAQFIETLCGVRVFRSAEQEVNSQMLVSRKEADRLQTKLDQARQGLAQAEQDAETNKRSLRQSAATAGEQKKQLQEQKKQLASQVTQLEVKKRDVMEFFARRGQNILGLSGQIEEAEKELSDIDAQLTQLTSQEGMNQQSLRRIDGQLKTLGQEMAVAKHRYSDLQCIEEGRPCPTCGNVGVAGSVREQLLEVIPARLSELADTMAKLKGEEAELHELQELRAKQYEELRSEREAAQGNKRAWSAERAGLQQQQNATTGEMAGIERSLAGIRGSVAELNKSITGVDESVKKLEEHIRALDTQLEEVRGGVKEIEAGIPVVQNRLIRQQSIADCLASLRRQSYLGTIDRINANLPVYSEIMSGGVYSVKIDSFSDKGEEKIVFRVNESTSLYHTLSTGQKARVDMAVQGAQIELLQCNLAIFDEVDWGLDPAGQAGLLDLAELLGKRKTVFMTSHSEWLKRGSETQLTVFLENGRSRFA